MIDIQDIENALLEIAQLLRASGSVGWADLVDKHIYNFMKYPKEVSVEILAMYGGAGSFNDLVLCKNGQLLKEENDEFYKLRSLLYNLCGDYIAEGRELKNQGQLEAE